MRQYDHVVHFSYIVGLSTRLFWADSRGRWLDGCVAIIAIGCNRRWRCLDALMVLRYFLSTWGINYYRCQRFRLKIVVLGIWAGKFDQIEKSWRALHRNDGLVINTNLRRFHELQLRLLPTFQHQSWMTVVVLSKESGNSSQLQGSNSRSLSSLHWADVDPHEGLLHASSLFHTVLVLVRTMESSSISLFQELCGRCALFQQNSFLTKLFYLRSTLDEFNQKASPSPFLSESKAISLASPPISVRAVDAGLYEAIQAFRNQSIAYFLPSDILVFTRLHD